MKRITTLRIWVAATACALTAISPVRAQQELLPLNVLIANERSTTFYGMFVADALGYFEEAGVDVNWLSSATTIPYVAFLSNQQADLVMMDASQVFQAVDANQPISVIYEDMQYAPESIYVSADSPAQTLADLRGETIGLASDRDRITVQVALKAVGLTIDDVSTAVVGEAGATLANAFRSNTVAAVAAGANELNTIQANGIQIRNITPPEVSENPANSFVIWKDRTEELRPTVERFLLAWGKGMEAGAMDLEAAAAVMTAAIPEQWENYEVGMQLLEITANQLHKPLTEERGDLQPDVWERVQAPLIEIGEISQQLDPSTFLDPSFIEAANQYDEAEIRADIDEWKAANPEALAATSR